MGEKVGSESSELGSVTSSQLSFLKNCPFADLTKSSGGVEDTEVLGTPILSLSTPISLDSINDEDVFRTPPENASLSSAAESEPRVRVSEIEPRRGGGGGGGSELKSTPVSASPAENARVLETNRAADSEELVRDVTPPGGASKLRSPSPVTEVTPLSPPSVTAVDVRAPGKPYDSSSPYATEGTESDIPFKEVMEALLGNNGKNLEGRDVSYVDILKQFGLKFP